MLAELLTAGLLFSETLLFCFKSPIAATLAAALLWSGRFLHFLISLLYLSTVTGTHSLWNHRLMCEAFGVWVCGMKQVWRAALCQSGTRTFPFSGHSCPIVWKNNNENGPHPLRLTLFSSLIHYKFHIAQPPPRHCFWKHRSSGWENKIFIISRRVAIEAGG